MHHVKLIGNSQFATKKRVLSCHHAMHHFHAILPIILLFYESHPEERANHAITPYTTSTLSRQLLCCFTNHALKKGPITPSRQPLGVPHLIKYGEFINENGSDVLPFTQDLGIGYKTYYIGKD